MTNAFQLFRSLVIYGICLPLAIFIGYLLATPTDFTTFTSIGLLLGFMTIPIFLKWHYPILIFCWNAVAGLYFLPGKPSWLLIMTFTSFGISMLAFILNRNLKFISVPSMTRPILFMSAVVLVTARFTGGIGFGAFGAAESGGKRYLILFSAIFGYFALTAKKIPHEKANLYIKLYFLGGLTALIGGFFAFLTPALYPIFLIFPAEIPGAATSTEFVSGGSVSRFGGLATTSMIIISYMFAKQGLTGVLDLKKYWRTVLFLGLVIATMFGGYRSKLIELLLIIAVLFYMEGLFRSRMLPMIILCLIMGVSLIVPFSDRLPLPVQRTLTFLPLKLDPTAEMNAKSSSDWRLEMWAGILPQVPKYLIMGKGYSIDSRDMDMFLDASNGSDSATGAAMAGDYHNGPLSLVMPFGVPGVIGFLWILFAGGRILYKNYKYGDPDFKSVNRYFYVYFLVKSLMFFVIFGSLYSDLIFYLGAVGFSIALNGGVKSAVSEPAIKPMFHKFRLANAMQ